jgi:hypothetical protein
MLCLLHCTGWVSKSFQTIDTTQMIRWLLGYVCCSVLALQLTSPYFH